jgi:hypothetical protein
MTRALIVKLDRSFAGDTPARNNFHRGFHRRLQQKDSVPLQHCGMSLISRLSFGQFKVLPD